MTKSMTCLKLTMRRNLKSKGRALSQVSLYFNLIDPFFVEGVTELTTATLRDAMYMVEFSKNQRSKCTEDNSSKSHFVLTLTVIQENVITKISKIGELSFVDLVACERINDPKLLMSRSALQQNSTINKGLSYLSTCIENMANGRKGDFRSCNLTKYSIIM